MNKEQEYLKKKYKSYGCEFRPWSQFSYYYDEDLKRFIKLERYTSSLYWRRQANRQFRHQNEELIGKHKYHKHNGYYIDQLY